ncbi:MAG: metal-dependent hydrolase [Phycisphaerae bacterium]|nr:MAG: metal-dependent hydrolase [Phycisphaerae bacterium]
MVTFSVQSGSNGNCIYVETDDARLLFDAGVSGKQLEQRMAEHNRSPRDVDALLISHEHSDHVRCAGIFHRKFDLPIYMTRPTHYAVQCDLGKTDQVRHFIAGHTLEFGVTKVHTFSTPHDAVDGVVFVVEHDGTRLAILTDLGYAFKKLDGLLDSVDAAYLESNYDVDMLQMGEYPAFLKARIRGKGGHLSNCEAAGVLRRVASKRHQWIALSHLSGQNNTPDIALETHHRTVGKSFPFDVSSREGVSCMRTV